jgi:hypothetical protein
MVQPVLPALVCKSQDFREAAIYLIAGNEYLVLVGCIIVLIEKSISRENGSFLENIFAVVVKQSVGVLTPYSNINFKLEKRYV